MNLKADNGRTPFHVVSMSFGELDVVQLFIEKAQELKLNVNVQDKDGRAALHEACATCNYDVVQLLIEVCWSILKQIQNQEFHHYK